MKKSLKIRKPMTNKMKKFLYTLEHLIPDVFDEIPTFAFFLLSIHATYDA